jgi:hypothetical protein
MAFRDFRYLREAQPGLDALAGEDVPYEALVERIRTVMSEWQPKSDDEREFFVPFHGYLLIFTVSDASPKTLVLAEVRKQSQ